MIISFKAFFTQRTVSFCSVLWRKIELETVAHSCHPSKKLRRLSQEDCGFSQCRHTVSFKASLDDVVKPYLKERQWWHTPLMPALGRQRQADF